MATDADHPLGPLSEFGQDRTEHIARERAERIDSQTSTWRHYASLAVGLVSVGAWLAALVTFVVLLGFPFFDVPLMAGLKELALNAGVGSGAALLSSYLSNPDAEDLV